VKDFRESLEKKSELWGLERLVNACYWNIGRCLVSRLASSDAFTDGPVFLHASGQEIPNPEFHSEELTDCSEALYTLLLPLSPTKQLSPALFPLFFPVLCN
jgi:hypothetical protein